MNQTIISEFNNLINTLLYEKPTNYSFKVNSFKKTIELIKQLNFEISDITQLKDIKGIGKGTLDRIKEILSDGNLKENEKKINNASQNEFIKLQTITGIGPSKAKQLIEKNITFDNLMNQMKETNPNNEILSNLTHHQLLGIKYYYDILKPIPHETIIEVEKYLNKFNFKFNICGSYRRKKTTSGDIDILIEKEDKSLKEIVDLLYKKKFLLDHLTECGETKYMGICKIKKSHCMRIDIRLISKESYHFALLYFTGSKKTNTFMRNNAIKLGLKLNEYSLMDKNNQHINLNTEQEIFQYLNLTYIEPENR